MKILIIISLGVILGVTSSIVGGKIEYAQQSAALQTHFKGRIQELTESNQRYVVGYFEDGLIGSIFVLRDEND